MTTKAKTILSWLVPIIIGLIIALIIRQFWFTMVKVDGDSMQPNLQNNQRVVAVKTSAIKRGSVIVFHAYGVDAAQADTTPSMSNEWWRSAVIPSVIRIVVNSTLTTS